MTNITNKCNNPHLNNTRYLKNNINLSNVVQKDKTLSKDFTLNMKRSSTLRKTKFKVVQNVKNCEFDAKNFKNHKFIIRKRLLVIVS